MIPSCPALSLHLLLPITGEYISLYLRQNVTNYENEESLNVTVECVAILKFSVSNLSSKPDFLREGNAYEYEIQGTYGGVVKHSAFTRCCTVPTGK
jgi:hypothetical protein